MSSNYKFQAFLTSFTVLMSCSLVHAGSLEDARALKNSIAAKQSSLSQLQAEVDANNQQISLMESQRHFYQWKSQTEKDLIANTQKQTQDLTSQKADLDLSQKKLRFAAKQALLQSDRGYYDMQVIIRETGPVVSTGVLAVKQLKAAKTELKNSLFAATANSISASVNSMIGADPSSLDKMSQLETEENSDRALLDSKNAFQTTINFKSQISDLSQVDQSMLGGTWSTSMDRGMIYYMLNGEDPLSSNTFNMTTSLLQIDDLSVAQNQVGKALVAIEPTVTQMSQEFSEISQKAAAVEDNYIAGL